MTISVEALASLLMPACTAARLSHKRRRLSVFRNGCRAAVLDGHASRLLRLVAGASTRQIRAAPRLSRHWVLGQLCQIEEALTTAVAVAGGRAVEFLWHDLHGSWGS